MRGERGGGEGRGGEKEGVVRWFDNGEAAFGRGGTRRRLVMGMCCRGPRGRTKTGVLPADLAPAVP